MDKDLILKGVALLWCLLIVVGHGMAADFTGEVIRVLDGDTIEVLHEKSQNASGYMALIARKRGKHSARRPSKPLLHSS
jgi:hypothetical protein